MALKNCSRCKKPFVCSNETKGCWCETLMLDTTTLNLLRNEFNDCLCKDCLQVYAANIISQPH